MEIQQCIQDCHNTASQLRSLANQAPNPQVRQLLDESAHHVDVCVKHCEFASQRVQRAGW